jgi:thiol peroxidase
MGKPVERTGVATLRGRPITLLGPRLREGGPAPDFAVLGNDMSPVTLASSAGKVRLISSVPSLDTEVCDVETRRFNQEAASLPSVALLTVSVDLPFAQRRWCTDAEVDAVRTLSDHRDLSFGLAYGVAIKELRLLSRAVFVVDANDVVVWAQYVPELGEHPDYEGALAAVKSVL